MKHSRHTQQPLPIEDYSGFTPEQKVLGLAVLAIVIGFLLFHSVKLLPLFSKLGQLFRFKGRGSGIRAGSAFIPDQARLRHSHIVGATGTGKTVLLEQLVFQDLKRGNGAIIIDPKGERAFFESIKDYCREIGREQDLILLSASNPEESAVWNPCALGSISELQTKFYNSAVYAEPHYAKAVEYALGEAFTTLAERHTPFTLGDLREEFETLAKGEHKEAFQGLYYDLHALLKSEWREVLGVTPGDTRPTVSLLEVISKNKILFVDLPTEGKLVQSSRLGRLLTQEIILISGMRKRNPLLMGDRPFSVFIDEFDVFATESFSTFLNKGRSSNFMIHLAHQTLSDLNNISPSFAGQILGNCNVRFIFRQDEPDDAERWSRFIGTKKTIKQTYRTQGGQTTGDSSNREVLEFIIPPDRIKSLPIGRCIFSMKTEGVCRELQIPFTAKKRKSISEDTPPLEPVQVARPIPVPQPTKPVEAPKVVVFDRDRFEGDRKWNESSLVPIPKQP